MTDKICAKCKNLKTQSSFHRNSLTKDGLHSYCKECRNPASTRYMRERRLRKKRLGEEEAKNFDEERLFAFTKSILRQYGETV